ncbi:hypothetical protein OC834_000729 [Tilletia horrida]|nr:hypothetical protein OC834_000729 [Tilletia horrida]
MPPPSNCYSRRAFGALPDPPPRLPSNAEDIHVFDWHLNSHRRQLCLSLAHRGALFRFKLSSDNDFGKRIYDAVLPSWQAGCQDDDGDDDWCNLNMRDHVNARLQTVVDAELEVLGAAVAALPELCKTACATNSAPVEGSILLIDLTGPLNVQAALQADVFRDILFEELPRLEPDDCSGVPRVESSAITLWASSYNHDNVFGVNVRLPGDASLERTVVLKTLKMPEPFDATHSMLLAIMKPATRAQAEQLLVWAVDLCHGTHHLATNGFFHPDLSIDNTLLWSNKDTAADTAAQGDGQLPPMYRRNAGQNRLLVSDIEPLEYYNNKDGPPAPEALGLWRIFADETGSPVYERVPDEQVSQSEAEVKARFRTIYAQLEQGLPTMEARERLLVYSLGCALAHLLTLRIHFKLPSAKTSPRTDDNENAAQMVDDIGNGIGKKRHWSTYVRTRPFARGDDVAQDEWEAYFPTSIQELVRRCVAFDPRERPLLSEVVETMERSVGSTVDYDSDDNKASLKKSADADAQQSVSTEESGNTPFDDAEQQEPRNMPSQRSGFGPASRTYGSKPSAAHRIKRSNIDADWLEAGSSSSSATLPSTDRALPSIDADADPLQLHQQNRSAVALAADSSSSAEGDSPARASTVSPSHEQQVEARPRRVEETPSPSDARVITLQISEDEDDEGGESAEVDFGLGSSSPGRATSRSQPQQQDTNHPSDSEESEFDSPHARQHAKARAKPLPQGAHAARLNADQINKAEWQHEKQGILVFKRIQERNVKVKITITLAHDQRSAAHRGAGRGHAAFQTPAKVNIPQRTRQSAGQQIRRQRHRNFSSIQAPSTRCTFRSNPVSLAVQPSDILKGNV